MTVLRTMTAAEVARALDWAAAEGWNPGLDDAGPFHAADPDGFFAAEADGKLVAAISVVNHGPDFAFLGLYLCLPEYRGKGIGYALWQHALAHAGDRTVGLDGVPAQQDNYRRSGFDLAGQTSRYVGVIPARAAPGLRPAAPADQDALTAMEAAASGTAKPGFMAAWLGPSPSRHTLVLDREGNVAGFATARACRAGYKIGPLVADDDAAAADLLHGAAELFPGQVAMIDLPGDQPVLAAHCAALGMTVPFSTARMYRGSAPRPGPGPRAVATLELG